MAVITVTMMMPAKTAMTAMVVVAQVAVVRRMGVLSMIVAGMPVLVMIMRVIMRAAV